MDGTIKPDDVKIDGEHTEKELEVIRAQKAKARQELEDRKAAQRAKDKAAERDKWWRGAEYLREKDEEGGAADVVEIEGHSFPKRAVRPYVDRDANDYSNWDSWVQKPDDPVSLEDMQRQQAEVDVLKDAEFEKANPEFCTNFKDDMEKRREATVKKANAAERNKELGNRLFRKRKYAEARTRYEEALQDAPWTIPILTNLAQCHLKLKTFEDAIEYCDRAVYLRPDCVKALSRRAKAWHALGQPSKACSDVAVALTFAPDDDDLAREHDRYKGDADEEEVEAGVLRAAPRGRGAHAAALVADGAQAGSRM